MVTGLTPQEFAWHYRIRTILSKSFAQSTSVRLLGFARPAAKTDVSNGTLDKGKTRSPGLPRLPVDLGVIFRTVVTTANTESVQILTVRAGCILDQVPAPATTVIHEGRLACSNAPDIHLLNFIAPECSLFCTLRCA